MTPAELLELFERCAVAQRDALLDLRGRDRRARTGVKGQYALDVVADRAVLAVLHGTPVAVVSEESGRSGAQDAAVTVVVDPVDGSTNCAHEIPYWGISLCAVDAQGLLCALVTNAATSTVTTAVRGEGAWTGGTRLRAAPTQRVEDSLVVVSGMPRRRLPWKQFRALGASALALCDLAAGRVDAFVDAVPDSHAPWDYLGGLLICREAGAVVWDCYDRELVVTDADARRQLLAASTPELAAALRPAVEELP